MDPELLEILPQELKFIFEFKKQSSCSIQLVNKSDHHVAFKVKTTSSRKYCVKPNTGVIKPNLTCDLTVTMQAQSVALPDFKCKDKFLIQSMIVPKGTKEEQITSTMFAKEDGKHIKEKKLNVILVSPPCSPVLSPMNEIMRMRPYNEAIGLKDDIVQSFSSHGKVDEDSEVSSRDNELIQAMKNDQCISRKHTEELRLNNDVEEMKSKLREIETILRQDKQRTQQNTETRAQNGFQFMLVFLVALASLYVGYLLHS